MITKVFEYKDENSSIATINQAGGYFHWLVRSATDNTAAGHDKDFKKVFQTCSNYLKTFADIKSAKTKENL